MSTRHSTEKWLFGPFAQNLGAVDYFQHNQQLEMAPPAAKVDLAVKACPGLEGVGQWISRSWRGRCLSVIYRLPMDLPLRRWEGDAGKMLIRDEQITAGMAGKIGDMRAIDDNNAG